MFVRHDVIHARPDSVAAPGGDLSPPTAGSPGDVRFSFLRRAQWSGAEVLLASPLSSPSPSPGGALLPHTGVTWFSFAYNSLLLTLEEGTLTVRALGLGRDVWVLPSVKET